MKKILNITLIIFVILALTGCLNNENRGLFFAINGEEIVQTTKDQNYLDDGFVALDDGEDISSYVTVDNHVDVTTVGTYTVTYTLTYQGEETILTRTVYVQYLNSACTLIEDTNTLECYKSWSSYLHTLITIKIYFNQYDNLDSEEIFNKMEKTIILYHQLSDKYDTYDDVINIKTINDDPATTHQISPELFSLISFTLENQKSVADYYNAALGPVIEIWHDYREDCLINEVCEVPGYQELIDANAFTDPNEIILDEENSTITMQEQMSLDLGGVSKGYLSNILIAYLDSLNLSGYLLNNGESNLSIGGSHPTRESGEYLLAITDPTNTSAYYATIFLDDGKQLVTSGDYQQYYMIGDTLYHHIISNTTLMPERNCRSVSVIYSDPALADIYSTAIFLMTIEDGQSFVNGIDGLEAIWYGIDGSIYFSENFQELYLYKLY